MSPVINMTPYYAIVTAPDWGGISNTDTLSASDGATNDNFGNCSLSQDSAYCIVGAYLRDAGGTDRGGAYIYNKSGTWSQQQILVPSVTQNGLKFGAGVDIDDDGNTAIVSAPGYNGIGSIRGGIFVFTRSGSSWTEQDVFEADSAVNGDEFGNNNAIALSGDGDTLAGGAYSRTVTQPGQGVAQIFTRSGSVWSFEKQLVADDALSTDQFGYSVALSQDGNVCAVGAPNAGSSGSVYGAVYVFTRSGSTWTQQQKLQASDKENSDQFGSKVRLSSDGKNLIVGAPGENSQRGACYIFTETGGTWSEQQKIVPSTRTASATFGVMCDINLDDGNIVVIGEPGAGVNKAHVFTRSGSSWTSQQTINGTNFFGGGATINGVGDEIVIGAILDGGSTTGLAYVYHDA